MSRTVTGYQDGRPIYRDDGPARARPVGWGGAALGQATTTFTVGPSTAVRKAAAQRDVERRRVAREKARTVT